MIYEIVQEQIEKYKDFTDFLNSLTDIGELVYITPEQIMQEIKKDELEIETEKIVKTGIPYFGKLRDAEIHISHGKGRNRGNKYLIVAIKDTPVYTNIGWFLGKRVFIREINTNKKTKWKKGGYDIYTDKPIKGSNILADLEAFYKKAKEANDDNKTPSIKVA